MHWNERHQSQATPLSPPLTAAQLVANLWSESGYPQTVQHSIAEMRGALQDEYRFLLKSLIDEATLDRAINMAVHARLPVHKVLVDHGWVIEKDYAHALAVHLGLGLADQFRISAPAGHVPSAHIIAMDAIGDGRAYLIVRALAVAPARFAAVLAAYDHKKHSVLIATSSKIDQLQLQPLIPTMTKQATFGLAERDETLSALRGITRWQASAICLMICAVGVGGWLYPKETVQAVLFLLTLPILCMGLLRMAGLNALFLANERLSAKGGSRIPDHSLPAYTVLVALYREAAVLPRLVRSLTLLDYPATHLEILLVVEANDHETRAAIASLDMPGNIKTVVVPHSLPRTKPKALNYALGLARGQYVVVYDAEDRPEPDQLRKALAKFASASPDLVCLQARLNTYNANETFLTRQFTIEYTVLFDAILPALERFRLPLPLGGTSNHFKIDVLRHVGAWDPHNVTEDADLGIRLARFGYRTGTIDSTTWEEAPINPGNWLRQRTRWLKGWMQTYLVHLRNPVLALRQLGLSGFLGMQVLMAGILVSVLVHPWMYVMFAIDFWQGDLGGEAGGPLDYAIWWLALFNIGLGLVSTIGVGMIAVWRRGWRRLAVSCLLMPVYWILISVAGYRALVQLVRQPHLWEKTSHGTPHREGAGKRRA